MKINKKWIKKSSDLNNQNKSQNNLKQEEKNESSDEDLPPLLRNMRSKLIKNG